MRPGADIVALVKPQFEAERHEVKRGGVVRDPLVHAAVIGRVAWWCVNNGLRVRGVAQSPLLGPAGNREFFLWLRLDDDRERRDRLRHCLLAVRQCPIVPPRDRAAAC